MWFFSPHPTLSQRERGFGLEYDFVVKPGGNVEDIRLRYKGAEGIEIAGGKLSIKTTLGEIWEEMPAVYQIIKGERVAIEAAYILKSNEVSIEVGDYDKSKELIIDPWITYYGGGSDDKGYGAATDGSGNVVITGQTSSFDFPVSIGAFQTSFGGGFGVDAFVVKFDAAGNRLWATYYGGSSNDQSYEIAIDRSGNVLITGETESANFPVMLGAFQTTHAGGIWDAFVVKFDAGGNRLWATYYGGGDSDWGNGIATDGSGNVVITGYTSSNNFPVLGAFQSNKAGGSDAFVVKLDALGSRIWATYYGGSGSDYAYGIVIDGSDNVVITGYTFSNNFPVLGAFQSNKAGGSDAFVVKLDALGSRIWATYYGGSGADHGQCIATDGSGNVLITGNTSSNNFPVLGAFQMSNAGFSDAFVVKLDGGGNRLWATYLGGSDTEEGWGITVDGSDNIFVCGDTYSFDFQGATPGAFQTTLDPGGTPAAEDNYMVKFDANGNLVCGTYLGGSGHDEMWTSGNIAVFGGFVYMTGLAPDNYPVTPGSFQTVFGGAGDAWIAQLCDDCTMNCSTPLLINARALPNIICQDSCTNLSSSAAGGNWGPYTFSWTSIPSGFTSSAQDTVACPDTTTIYIVTVNDGDTILTDSVTVVVLPAPIVYLGADTTICSGDSVILDAGNPGASYNWSTGENTQIITVNSAGIYWVKVNDGRCIELDTININIENCDTTKNTFFIPNSFSPNKDGDNDVLFVRGSGIKNVKLFIYNRWGEKVFETYNINKGWDGTYKGRKLNPAVFAWYAEVEFSDGDRIYRKGNVTLIR